MDWYANPKFLFWCISFYVFLDFLHLPFIIFANNYNFFFWIGPGMKKKWKEISFCDTSVEKSCYSSYNQWFLTKLLISIPYASQPPLYLDLLCSFQHHQSYYSHLTISACIVLSVCISLSPWLTIFDYKNVKKDELLIALIMKLQMNLYCHFLCVWV